MNPACSDLHALFANSLLRLFNVSDRINVNAYFCCHEASIQFGDDSLLGVGAPQRRRPHLSTLTTYALADFFFARSCCMYSLIAATFPGLRCSDHSSKRFAAFSRFPSRFGSLNA